MDEADEIAGLKKNVGFLNWAVGIMFVSGLGAIATSYVMLANDIRQLTAETSARGSTLASIEKSLERIEGKVDADVAVPFRKPYMNLEGGRP